MNTKGILTLAVLGVGAYFAWNYFRTGKVFDVAINDPTLAYDDSSDSGGGGTVFFASNRHNHDHVRSHPAFTNIGLDPNIGARNTPLNTSY